MSIKKSISIVAIILLLPILIFICAVGIVYYHQNEILSKVLHEVNEKIDGEITISNFKIAPFKSFPYVSIDLKNVNFFESKDMSCKPLYTFNDVYCGFDIKSAFKGTYDIKSISVEDGHIDIIQFTDGTNNIMKAKGIKDKEETNTSEKFHIDLKKISIKNVDIAYLDHSNQREIDVLVSALKAKIKYKDDHFYIDLVSDLKLDVLFNDKPTFFVNKLSHLDFELDYDKKLSLLNIKPSKMSLNQANFNIDGSIDVANDFDSKIYLKGDKPDFGFFTAFLPNDIAEGLASYKNEGKIYYEGSIVGKATNGHIPLINFTFGCEEAYFLNKFVNKKVDQLRFKGSFTNGQERTLASSILQIHNFHARPEEGVFEGHLYIKNFLDPIVKLDIHADLDLQFLSQFFSLKSLEHVKGKILVDMNFDEIVDLNFPGESLARLKTGIDSELTIKDLSLKVPELNYFIENMNGHAEMKEGRVVLDSISWQIGKNDFWISGSLSDLPALFHKHEKDIRVELMSKSSQIDLGELFAFDTTMAKKYNETLNNFRAKLAFETKANELFTFKYLPRGEFFIEDFYVKFKHYPHILHDFHADVIITEKDLSLIDFSGEIDSTDFHFTGKLINYSKWFQPEPVGDSELEFDLTSTFMKLDNLLSYNGVNYVSEDYRHEIFRDTKLHGRVAMHYDGGFKSVDLYLDEFTSKLKIHPLKLEKFKGRAHYENDHLLLEQFYGKMGRSDIKMNMSYYLGDKKELQTRSNYLNFKSNVLDLDALTNYNATQTEVDHAKAFNFFEVPFPNINITAEIGKMNYHRYWIENIHSKLRLLDNHFLYIDTLNMDLADGNMKMKGYFNGSNSKDIYYYSDISVSQLDIDKLMIKFDHFGQDQTINENIHGKITGNIKSTLKLHPDFTPIIDKSNAQMDLTITNGSIVNFTPIQAMSKYFKDKNLNNIRFDTLRNVLDLRDGILSIPNMNINSSLGFIEISGKQKLDLSMEYFLRVPLKIVTKVGLSGLFGKKRQEEIDPEQIDEIQIRDQNKKVSFVNLKIVGNTEDFKVSLGKDKNKK